MGGGGHGHGHEPPYKVPDYKIYKVEDVPELMQLQQTLKKEGLKDPWLRNHVWKYDKPHKTPKYIFDRTLGRGMKYGFILALITTGIGYMLPDMQWHGIDHEKGHGHGHEGGAAHH